MAIHETQTTSESEMDEDAYDNGMGMSEIYFPMYICIPMHSFFTASSTYFKHGRAIYTVFHAIVLIHKCYIAS